MKRLLLVAVATLAFLATAASAATATSSFNVALTLNSQCFVNIVTTGATPASGATTNVTLTYTAFQTTDAQASTSFNVRCTNTLPYSVAVATQAGSAAGVNYFLSLAAGASPTYVSAASTTAATLSTGLSGSGLDQQYTVGVDAPAGQAGTCATASCTASPQHTVTVTY